MSRIPPAVARRLDRLARRAHAFHRFAHHPLCRSYAGEVVRVGRRTLLCRGCLLASAGAALGVVAGLVSPTAHPAVLAVVLAVAGAAVRAAVLPPGRGPRRSKLLTRAAPAATAAALATMGLRARGAAGAAVAAAVVAMALAAVALYRRRAPDRSPCLACPERDVPRICSGYRRMARREAAFTRRAGRLLRGYAGAQAGAGAARRVRS